MPKKMPSRKEQIHIADNVLFYLEQIRQRLWADDCEDVLDDVWPNLVRVRDLVVMMVYGGEEE